MQKIYILFIAAVLIISVLAFSNIFATDKPEKEDEIEKIVLDKYRQQAKGRSQLLMDSVNSNTDLYGTLYNVLVPEVFCRNLIRIGDLNDGGKFVCNPNEMLNTASSCTIYSLGINEDPSFEEDLQNFLGNKCKVRCVDKNIQSPTTLERIKNINGVFRQAFISGKKNETLNMHKFKEILSGFGDPRIDILKMDIEGAEFNITEELFSIPICQILIEIHGKTTIESFQLLQKFSQHGFYLFSYEINGYHHNLSEYSFIHESCLSDFGVKTIYGKFLG